MKKTKRIIISLTVLIPLSLFFFYIYLDKKIQSANITKQQFNLVVLFSFYETTKQRLDKLIQESNINAWLHLLQLDASTNSDSAFILAQYHHDKLQIHQAKLWYQQAIRLNNPKARLALAELHLNEQQYDEVANILRPIRVNDKALIMLFKVAMIRGDIEFIMQYESQLATSSEGKFYQELVKFGVFETNIATTLSENNSCSIDLQLFATSYKGLQHAQQLISVFSGHKLAEYICLQSPQYISKQQVNCSHNINERITCDASIWRTKAIKARYITLIVEQGGANVDNGIMYLDLEDNVDVFTHELTHFLGFIDEYPLPTNHQRCANYQEAAFAHNVAILPLSFHGDRMSIRASVLEQLAWGKMIKSSTPILMRKNNAWQLGTPHTYQGEVGVFLSESCDKSNNIQAFKPLHKRTKLQYFELKFPDEYLDILMFNYREFLMPSYHFNVSKSLAQRGELSKARQVMKQILFD